MEQNASSKLIAIYARVSTSRQEEEQTIQNQINKMEEYATEHGHTIVRRYLDDGWSGDTLARPALDELRQDARTKQWETILMYDPDRLARRYSYQELVMDELQEAGIEVLYVTISAPKNSEDKMMYGMRGLFAEYERMKITERFRMGKHRKVKEGHLLVSEPLYGYSYVPKLGQTHGYYVVNEIEARVVRMIFSWVANEKMTLRSVVKKLNEMDIRPRKSNRGVWSTSTLSTMLRNEAYIGSAHWGASYAVAPLNPQKNEKYKRTKKSSRKARPKNEWHTIPVPAIIDPSLFARVRKQVDDNFALCQRNKKNEYLLAGRINCVCGRRRTGEGVLNGKHLYYRCTDRVSCYPLPHSCKEMSVNARVADELVWERLSSLMTSPKLLHIQVSRWFDDRNARSDVNGMDIDTLKREVEKLKATETRYNKAYGAEALTLSQLKELTTPLRESLRTLETQIAQVQQSEAKETVGQLPTEQAIKQFAQRARIAIKNLSYSEKRAIVLATVEKVVGTKKKLHVSGYIPINNHVEYKTIDWYRRTSERWQIDAF